MIILPCRRVTRMLNSLITLLSASSRQWSWERWDQSILSEGCNSGNWEAEEQGGVPTYQKWSGGRWMQNWSDLKGNDVVKRELTTLGLIEISQSVLSISISSGFLLVLIPLLMGVEQKCLSWDRGCLESLWPSVPNLLPYPPHQAFAAHIQSGTFVFNSAVNCLCDLWAPISSSVKWCVSLNQKG